MRPNRVLQVLFIILAPLAVSVLYVRAMRSSDFMVYYRASRVLIEGHGHLYGPLSGIGWPQYFRYSPLFLLVFLPFALLPYKVAVAVWAALKCATLYLLVRALGRRLDFARTGYWWLLAVLLCGGFVVQELSFGNAQFLIFAMVAASLLWLDEHLRSAVFLLAMAASLKIWPLFFVPYLAARRRTRMALQTLVLIGGLTLLPAAYFGWTGNLRLLREWAAQEWATGSLQVGMWFPHQSLSGILQRYLTLMDYSTWTDGNYVQLHLLHLSPVYIPWIWALLAASAYLGLLWMARQTVETGKNRAPVLVMDSLAFCALPLLEPFAHRIAFVVLLWPAMVAAALLAREGIPSPWSKALIYAAATIEAIEALTPGARMQRLFQILGVDFWATCILAAGLLTAWLEWRNAFASEVICVEVALDDSYELAPRHGLLAAHAAPGEFNQRAMSQEDDG
jgi:hypothetical protein